MRPAEAGGWISKACEEYRVVLLDQACFEAPLHFWCVCLIQFVLFLAKMFKFQRGTGLSTPLTTSSMSQFKSAEKLVDYLKHFRADNIVRDAEFVRRRLVPDSRPWTVMGQVRKYLLFYIRIGLST